MAFKDERGSNDDPGEFKGIRVTRFDRVGAPFDTPSRILTGKPAEGPTLLLHGNAWVLLYDEFLHDSFGGHVRRNGDEWTPLAHVRVPAGARHASVLPIDVPLFRALRSVSLAPSV